MDNKELPKAYNPADYEDEIYKKWEQSGFFNPDNLELPENAPGYCIVMPPPNVTGTLHMGHASMLALQDILIRYHRMKGERALWIPGTDHAAIATQTKVEKLIKDEGTSRHELGRDKFLERVRQFAQDSHDTIVNQVRKLGSSCDWSREAYTLDETRTKAVRCVFKLMYDDGLIYRGERVINWCPRCSSTLADDEVEYKARKAKVYYFKYDRDFPLTIATTRPETKLGDTAVAVNPRDERYKDFIGKTIEADFCGIPLKLKIIADRKVDMEFGTGALGVTPAHSMVDSQMASEHDLLTVKVIDEDGNIRTGFGEFSGMNVNDAREKIVEKLHEAGLIEKEEETENNLSVCYRCDTPVEPIPSLQWFIDVNRTVKSRQSSGQEEKSKVKSQNTLSMKGKTLKEIATEVVKDGQIKIIPGRFEKNYFHWMDDLRDWCISRQIWFGHRIPVWYKKSHNSQHIARNGILITYFAHGSTKDNESGTFSGNIDPALSELGIEQSINQGKLAAEKEFDLVITSDYQRAVKTAELMFEGKTIEMIQDKRLREVDLGNFRNFTEKEFFDNDFERININFPDGESYKDVERRIFDFLNEIFDKYPGKKIAIITHRIPQLALEVILNNKNWETVLIEDWRKKEPKTWQPGWNYQLRELVYVGVEPPEGDGWEQDPDTLDTWFSSGLWTFSTLAKSADQIRIDSCTDEHTPAFDLPSPLSFDHSYTTWQGGASKRGNAHTPDPSQEGNGRRLVIDSEDFKIFHPTAVMETGYDILFFWVARMIIMTAYGVEDIPFRDVYLHGLVLDEHGKKMSKSKGNVIDPLDMIALYGADSTRLSLVIGSTPGNDLRISTQKIAGYRNLVNKLWNIARFIIANAKVESAKDNSRKFKIEDYLLTAADRWILNKLK